MARVRWNCPNGCPGVLGPSRPRMNNICRYCLPCSQTAGILVERGAPALNQKRMKTAKRHKEKKQSAANREEARELERHSIAGLDLRAVVKLAGRLPALRPAAKMPWKLRRSAEGYTSGSFRWSHWAVTLPVGGEELSEEKQATRQSDAIGLVLHEMSHAACHLSNQNTRDGSLTFGRRCQRAFAQWNDRHEPKADEGLQGAYRGKRYRELIAEGKRTP